MELALTQPAAAQSGRADAPSSAPADADRALVSLVAEGDRRAFEALYHRWVRPVYALATRRLGNRESAEEAVQETFAAVWRSARTYRPERGPVGPWLYAIARNAVVDRLRSRPEPVSEIPDTADPGRGPDETAEADWLAWRVHRALEELPASERRVLALAYWGGRSQSQVAAELGIPLGTVKTRTRSGLARLADLLEGEELR